MTSPLDLSSPGGFAPRKRQRAETRRSGSVSPKPKATPRPTTPPPVRCPSLCGHMPCGDGQAVNRWTIEDVVNYVSSIDSCAEYAQVSHTLLFSRFPLGFPRYGSISRDSIATFAWRTIRAMYFAIRRQWNSGKIFINNDDGGRWIWMRWSDSQVARKVLMIYLPVSVDMLHYFGMLESVIRNFN